MNRKKQTIINTISLINACTRTSEARNLTIPEITEDILSENEGVQGNKLAHSSRLTIGLMKEVIVPL